MKKLEENEEKHHEQHERRPRITERLVCLALGCLVCPQFTWKSQASTALLDVPALGVRAAPSLRQSAVLPQAVL